MAISVVRAWTPVQDRFWRLCRPLIELKAFADANRKKVYTASAIYLAGMLIVGSGAQMLTERYQLGIDVGEKYHSNNRRLFLVTMEQGLRVQDVHRGDFVMFHTQKLMPYHTTEDNIIKRVIGMPGDRVRVDHDRLFVNGRFIDRLYLLERLQKKPGAFDTSYTIPPLHFFVFGAHPRSYDSRYWGLINIYNVKGHAKPLFD